MSHEVPAPVQTRASTVSRIRQPILLLVVVAGFAFAIYRIRDQWMPLLFPTTPAPESTMEADVKGAPSEQVLLSERAQKNLKLTSKPLTAETFWKTISVPGMVIDRSGASDRGVVSPVAGVVTRIHHVAGETVQAGDVLFTLRLLSESLQLTQTELFKATLDIKLSQTQRDRLASSGGAVPEARIVEVENQITRSQSAIKAYRQELLNRGLSPEQIDAVADGRFVKEIPIVVPPRPVEMNKVIAPENGSPGNRPLALGFEVEALSIELGQQVQPGQTLCLLANHQRLSIEGRAFRDETPLLERTVREGWPVDVDFAEGTSGDWPTLEQSFRITYLANTIDPVSRTFRFLMPLENQSRVVENGSKTQLLWQFRPGQRVRLQVRVEALQNVFILPVTAVAREGAEAYVFRQNGDIFDRKSVQVVYQDRQYVVIANDGSVPAGIYVAQTGAVQLNRMIKSQSGAMPKGFHIHADGSVHMGAH